MITDALCLLDDAHAYSATAQSTNSYDTGNVTPKNRVGDGRPMAILVTVDVTADFTTGDETYQFDVIDSPNANLSSPTVLASYKRVMTGVGAGQLVAGSVHAFPIPPGTNTQRYLGLQLTLAGTTPSVTITALIQPQDMIDRRVDYADAITIS